MRFTIKSIGLENVRAGFARELRAFQREKRVAMRKATNMMARGVRAKLRSGSPLKSGSGRVRQDSAGKRWGPLHKSIRTRVTFTTVDVMGIVRYSRAGFYGRAHELGVAKTIQRTLTRRVVMIDGRFVAVGPKVKAYRQTVNMRLPKREVLAPVADAKASAAVEIMGDAYAVFTAGRRVGR